MAQSTLWGAIDRDRRRWIRASAIVLVLLALLASSVWLVAVSRSIRAIELVVRLIVPVAAILFFPLIRAMRETRTSQALGAVPVATGMAPDTTRALNDVALAAGLSDPKLLLYVSDAPNAFVTREGGRLNIAVSSAFTELPRAEQRAGIAMLVGRSRIGGTSYAADHQLSESLREDPVPPDRDPVLFSAWMDAAVAGDREGLNIIREPAPMIELLERLSMVSTLVPEFAYSNQHDAVFGFLAWPYLDTAKEMALEVSAQGERLPPEAAAAVSALIAEEQIMKGGAGVFSGAKSTAFISGAEALRALKLREMAGAEGAVAGSTTTASRQAAKARHEAETSETPSTAENTAGGPATGSPAVGQVPRSARPVLDEGPVASEPVPVGIAGAFAGVGVATALPAAAALSRAERIEVHCPACHAGNAPGNRRCIACGERMPADD
jgi:hypothetical protein